MKRTVLILSIFILCLTAAYSQSADAKWLHCFNKCDARGWTNFNKFVSNSEVAFLIGVPLGMGIYDFVTKDMDHLDKTLGITASIAGTYAVSILTKVIVKRERPYERYPGYIINRVDESGYSFPSNHTGGAFALATSLSLNYPEWYIIAPAYLWATAVGYSRLQLGVHYPSDVIAGAIIGSACAYGTYQLQKLWTKKRIERTDRRVMLSYSIY